jgi:hypothetical protein
VVPEVWAVHVSRSDDVTIFPESPTATNFVPEVATPLRLTMTLEELAVQEIPSVEVRMVPSDPTVTACDAEEAML